MNGVWYQRVLRIDRDCDTGRIARLLTVPVSGRSESRRVRSTDLPRSPAAGVPDQLEQFNRTPRQRVREIAQLFSLMAGIGRSSGSIQSAPDRSGLRLGFVYMAA